jgi:hypothetical protein
MELIVTYGEGLVEVLEEISDNYAGMADVGRDSQCYHSTAYF